MDPRDLQRQPAAPLAGAPVLNAAEVAETHVSWVFLTPERAFKLLKPLDLGFLDHRAVEDRLRAADLEVELNRRLAPDVYLGTADVVEDGEIRDRMIVMRRLPADRRLSALVDTPAFADCLRAVARRVAVFHAASPPVADAPMASVDAVATNWADNLEVMRRHAGGALPADDVVRVDEQYRAYLAGREPLFTARIDDGFVRDGHGDLIAEDIYCEDDGPRIIDCLAFSDDLRIGDVLLDIGFLVMDVDRLAGPGPAARLLGWYQEFGNEHHPASLAAHYVAYRASVRAKVDCLRIEQGEADRADDARAHLDLVLRYLEQGRVRMVVVGGAPGTGKSTLAEGLGEVLGATVLRADVIRKELVGLPPGAHRPAAMEEGLYTTEMTDRTYVAMLDRADELLRRGESVVLDASWPSERLRGRARERAGAAHADLTELECVLPVPEATRRVERRAADGEDASDVTVELVADLTARRDPWPAAAALATEATPSEVRAVALEVLGRAGD